MSIFVLKHISSGTSEKHAYDYERVRIRGNFIRVLNSETKIFHDEKVVQGKQ